MRNLVVGTINEPHLHLQYSPGCYAKSPTVLVNTRLHQRSCAGMTECSRSASDNIRTIIEKTESVYVQKFQRLINGTLFSGEFSKSLTSEREAVGAYFASGFIDQ